MVEPVPPLPTVRALPRVRVPIVAEPKVAALEKRLVLDATEAKKLVVVALVPVAFAKTKLPVRVVEAKVAPVAVSPPEKLMEVEVALLGNG